MGNTGYFKKEAFLKEFPFVSIVLEKEGIKLEDLTKISVKPITEDLLNSVPVNDTSEGQCGETTYRETISFILKDAKDSEHNFYYDVILPKTDYRNNARHISDYDIEGESLLEGIARNNIDPNSILYIVKYIRHYDSWTGSNGYTNNKYIDVYKTAKGVNIASLIEQARHKAKEDVLQEANF